MNIQFAMVSGVNRWVVNEQTRGQTGANQWFVMEICQFASPLFPCVESSKELLSLSQCDRDTSTHLQTHGFSKSRDDISDEVDLLLCRAGKLSSLSIFPSLFGNGGKEKPGIISMASRRGIRKNFVSARIRNTYLKKL